MGLDTGIGQFGVGFQRFCVDPSGNTEDRACKHRNFSQMITGVGPGAGTATPGQTYEIYEPSQAVTLFGSGSPAAINAAIHFCVCPDRPIFITPLADPVGGVNAAYTLTVTGPATASGVLSYYIWPNLFSVNVVSGDTAENIAAAIALQINGSVGISFTATSLLGVVTLTAKNAGPIGNYWKVLFNSRFGQVFPAGVTVVQAQTVQGSGAIAPGVIAATLDECCFDCYSMGLYDDIPSIELSTYLDDETGTWSCANITCFGHQFRSFPASSVGALVALGNTFNDPALTAIPVLDSFPIPPYVFAAAWAARVCCNACIDPSIPVVRDSGFLTCLSYSSSCKGVFTRLEKQALDRAGFGLWEVSNTTGTNNTTLWIEANTTTYKFDKFGRPDKTWKQVETRYLTAKLIREVGSFYTSRYSAVSLVNNGTPIPAGRKAVSANIVKAELQAFLRQFLGILVDDGNDLDGVVRVSRNTDGQPNCSGDPNRLDVVLKIDTVNLLLRIATNVNIRLQTNCQTNRSLLLV